MTHTMRIVFQPLFGILLGTLLMLSACGDPAGPVQSALPREATVLVLGDSLVAGTGASREQSWPAVLAAQTGWRVVNAGVPGHTSSDALARLPGLLEEHGPDAVIIAIGGNDFLRRHDPTLTRSNLDQLLNLSKSTVRHVALIAIPEASVSGSLLGALSDHALYEELAAQHQVLLVEDAVSETLSREDFRADRIHANAQGYAHMAERIAAGLSAGGWLAR